MKTRVSVQRVQNGWAVIDHRTQVGDLHDSEASAQLHAHHYRHAPSLVKRLNLKKVDGVLTGRPFSGVKVSVYKQASGEWRANCIIDGESVVYVANTRTAVLKLIAAHGRDVVKTKNILNPEAGEIEISRSAWGGCTDPGTERYHSM